MIEPKHILGFLITVASLILGPIYSGYTLTVVWKWFVVPVFHLPILSIPTAIGLVLVMGYLTHQDIECEEKEKEFTERIASIFIKAFLRPTLFLGFAWIVTKFL